MKKILSSLLGYSLLTLTYFAAVFSTESGLGIATGVAGIATAANITMNFVIILSVLSVGLGIFFAFLGAAVDSWMDTWYRKNKGTPEVEDMLRVTKFKPIAFTLAVGMWAVLIAGGNIMIAIGFMLGSAGMHIWRKAVGNSLRKKLGIAPLDKPLLED